MCLIYFEKHRLPHAAILLPLSWTQLVAVVFFFCFFVLFRFFFLMKMSVISWTSHPPASSSLLILFVELAQYLRRWAVNTCFFSGFFFRCKTANLFSCCYKHLDCSYTVYLFFLSIFAKNCSINYKKQIVSHKMTFFLMSCRVFLYFSESQLLNVSPSLLSITLSLPEWSLFFSVLLSLSAF